MKKIYILCYLWMLLVCFVYFVTPFEARWLSADVAYMYGLNFSEFILMTFAFLMGLFIQKRCEII